MFISSTSANLHLLCLGHYQRWATATWKVALPTSGNDPSLPLLVYKSSAATGAASESKTVGAAAILKKKKVKSTKAF